jgi:hypothetical protein
MASLLQCRKTLPAGFKNNIMDFVTNPRTTEPRRSRGKGIFWKIALVALLIFGIYFYWKYFFTYSSGNRYGLLQKFSTKGNIFKTHEGELILSSVRSNNNVALASEKFYFTVNDRSTADKLMNVQGQYITVHYKEKNGALSWRGDSRYIVDSVTIDNTQPR